MTIRIGVYVFEDAEELDWAGPWEVLSAWAVHFEDDVEVFTFARHDGPVTCAKGLVVVPRFTWSTAPPMDVLIYPGGIGTRKHLGDEEVRSWLLKKHEKQVVIASVCTGSLVLADAGLLVDRPATTHWSALDRLAEIDPTIEVRPDDRFVDSGEIVTAAGVSAGIDMALHLIARFSSTERAREVRRYIQYDPEPPV